MDVLGKYRFGETLQRSVRRVLQGLPRLAQGVHAVKRTAIKKKSTKPRKHKDPKVYDAYRDRFGEFCEAAHYVGVVVVDGQLRMHWPGLVIQKDLQRHHLWSVSGQRLHLRSCLLTVCEAFHEWAHPRHLNEARVIGVLAKLIKREKIGEPEEFDLAQANFVSGKKVYGVIAGYDFFDDGLMNQLQQECLKRLSELERAR